jgi:hydroxymethylpyrimidine/phosphomethylpyrimidine kinase
LLAKGAHAVLVKGGHLPGDTVIDLLLTASGEKHWMQAPRIHSANTHGTGCTLSSAIAAGLAKGMSLIEAARVAKGYVTTAIAAADRLSIGSDPGSSHGPVHHFYRYW